MRLEGDEDSGAWFGREYDRGEEEIVDFEGSIDLEDWEKKRRTSVSQLARRPQLGRNKRTCWCSEFQVGKVK